MAYNKYDGNLEKDNTLRRTGSSFFNMNQNYYNQSNKVGATKPQIKYENDQLKFLNPDTKEAVDDYIKYHINNLNGNNYFINNNISKSQDPLNLDTSEVVNNFLKKQKENREINDVQKNSNFMNANENKSPQKSRNNQPKKLKYNQFSYNNFNQNMPIYNNQYNNQVIKFNKNFQINYGNNINNYLNDNVNGGFFMPINEDVACRQIFANYMRSRSPM